VARGAKKKGTRGERKLAGLLEEWCGLKFHRSPASGGLRWRDNAAKVRGDLICEDESFPFSIEVKNRESWDFKTFMDGGGKIFEWFDQAWADARATEKIPLLFITKNFSPYYAVFVRADLTQFRRGEAPKNFMTVTDVNDSGIKLTITPFLEFAMAFGAERQQ